MEDVLDFEMNLAYLIVQEFLIINDFLKVIKIIIHFIIIFIQKKVITTNFIDVLSTVNWLLYYLINYLFSIFYYFAKFFYSFIVWNIYLYFIYNFYLY